MKTQISVFIIAYNEENIIGKCLEKLDFAAEIIVVDSGSTDKTVEICNKFGAKVIFNKFENYGIQKQFALNQTSNDWVLSLDADEVLSNELISEIKNLDLNKEFSGYKIPRTHIFLNKVFKYGSENKKPILRFFNKKQGNFEQNKVHEIINVDGKIGLLKNEILHYTVSDIATAARKNLNYALLSGEFNAEKGKKSSILKSIFKIPYEFVRIYFIQLNFMNGYQGFVWSFFCSFGSFIKYAKLYELNKLDSKT
jgi:glycosyltransferase involved in cell wall biosynthesis